CSLPLLLAGPADSPLPAGKKVPFSEAAKLPLVLPSHHLGLRAVINNAAMQAQLKLNLRMEADFTRLLKDLLVQGVGYSFLPACFCKRETASAQLQLWPVGTPSLAMDVTLASRKNSQLTGPRIRAFETEIARIAAEHLTSAAPVSPPA
ncbi:MAG TPA: LysR substrate-binding domain-containing protein, partial [Acidocella sp.]|nr:LysR substrate-binding domain-containing protein [Acidocella sp.]